MPLLNIQLQHRSVLRSPDTSLRREFWNDLKTVLGKAINGESYGAVGDAYTSLTAATGASVSPVSVVVSDTQTAATAGTLTLASVAAGTALAVNGTIFYAVSGTPVRANSEFKVGVTDTADAADFVTTFAASSQATLLTASSALGVVTFTPVFGGQSANAFTFETLGIVASGTITLSSATGTLTATINGVAVTATAGATDTLSAVALAAAINASANALVSGFVAATSSAAVVTVYAKYTGLRGNAITLASSASGGTATASVARLAGGTIASSAGAQAAGTLTISSGSGTVGGSINGVSVTVTWASSDTATATALTAAIAASTNALIAGHVIATSSAGVVTLTAVHGGKSGNAITLTATGTGVTASGTGRLTGGAAATTVAFAGGAASSSLLGGRLTGGAQAAAVTFSC